MSNTNEGNTAPAPKEKKPRVVKLIDAKIDDAREDLAAAQKKLDALLAEKAARDRVENIVVGTEVRFEYGRAEKKRILTGVVIAVGTGEQAGQLAVTSGEGLDVQTYKIAAATLVFEDGAEGDPLSDVT